MWATEYIKRLCEGERVVFRPRGSSMVPRIHSGDECVVDPIDEGTELRVDDVVLCRVGKAQYLHKISAIRGKQFQISNNRGRVNGWIVRSKIYGKLVEVRP